MRYWKWNVRCYKDQSPVLLEKRVISSKKRKSTFRQILESAFFVKNNDIEILRLCRRIASRSAFRRSAHAIRTAHAVRSAHAAGIRDRHFDRASG